MELKLPELPPRHRLKTNKMSMTGEVEVSLVVRNTTWTDPGNPNLEEIVAFVEQDNGKFRVGFWKMRGGKSGSPTSDWGDHQDCDTLQEAVDYMCAGVMMGLAVYVMREE